MKNFVRLIAIILIAAFTAAILTSCTSEPVFTLTVTDEDGEHTYEMTYSEYKVYMTL